MANTAIKSQTFSAFDRERLIQAWVTCCNSEEKDGTEICQIIADVIKAILTREELISNDPKWETRVFFHAGACHLPLFLEQTGGFESFVEVIEESLLNGWPLKESKRHLREVTKQAIRDEVEQVGGKDLAREQVVEMLEQELRARVVVENENDDRELSAVFDETIGQYENFDLDEFLQRFEIRVLNFSKLKIPEKGPNPPPEQGLLF